MQQGRVQDVRTLKKKISKVDRTSTIIPVRKFEEFYRLFSGIRVDIFVKITGIFFRRFPANSIAFSRNFVPVFFVVTDSLEGVGKGPQGRIKH